MKHDRETGVVIPFRQNAEFYFQRGNKYLMDDDLNKAEQYLRKAYEMEPNHSEYMLTFAEALHRLHQYEESLGVLLTSLSGTEDPEPEVLFGIASDFIGLEEFYAAKQSLKLCVQKDPTGAYADRARELLETLENEPELEAQIGLYEDEDIRLLEIIHLAKAKHFSLDDDSGLNLLLSASEKYPNSEMLDMEIAIMLFSMREYDEAKKRLFNLFKRNSKSVRGNALLALIYHVQKQETEAKLQAKKILIEEECSPEELGYAAPILIELGEYDAAQYALELLRDALPYDKEMLHQLAFCRYVHGSKREAEQIYEELAARDESDSVAAYYKKHIKEDSDAEFRRDWTINYDVPIREAVLRQRRIRDVATAGVEALHQAWNNDREFRSILKWALYSPLSPSLRGTAKMLSLIRDAEAERMLRTFLIRFDQTDGDKQFIFGLLLGMEAKPPFSLYYQGAWQYGVAKPVIVPDRLPVSYESIYEMITGFEDLLHGDVRYRKIEVSPHLNDVASRIFYLYLASFEGARLPTITRAQENALAAAFVMMGLGAMNDTSIPPETICNVLNVSERRLANALKRVLIALHNEANKEN